VCAGYEFAHVATGKIAGHIAKDAWAAPYDLVPGVLLVEEAGGYVATPDQELYTVDALHVVVCANAPLFEQLKGAGLILEPRPNEVCCPRCQF
jgi:fructose-1,6-bisphosphatase/inositol monophosphatase family enzyme